MMALRGTCILVSMYLSIYLRTRTDLFTKINLRRINRWRERGGLISSLRLEIICVFHRYSLGILYTSNLRR